MSVDNWTVCPKCRKEVESEIQRRRHEAEKAYGKITPAEYVALIRAIETDAKRPTEETLREDYGIGINGAGWFSVEYAAFCTACKWEHRFKHSAPALPA